jgi:DNA-binding transcriptional LysR family regulator
MVNSIDLARVDLNLLVLFEAVMAERHVGRTAQRLHLSPSAISHGLGRLRRLLNDPLFLKTPKGVVPTGRAIELAAQIADVLSRARSVISTAEPFDPAKSTRRFTIAAPDGVAAVLLLPLVAQLRRHAPAVDISVRQLLPTQGETSPERAWHDAFVDLEARAMDIAIIPSNTIPARFERRTVYEEDFVIVARTGHPFASDPSLRRYCESQHVVVSHSGDPYGFVDDSLAKQGRSRRVALTVPNFLFALAVIAETDLIAALPRRFADMQAARFRLVAREAPLPMPTFSINAVVPKVAMMDGGVAWLFDLLTRSASPPSDPRRRSSSRKRGTRK